MKLLLLGTLGCHLCEDAAQIINQSLNAVTDVQIKLIDIAEDERWQQSYASLIPVLLVEETERALLWPFTQHDVINFLLAIKL